LRSIIVNVCRLVLAVTLVLSGFVKAIDPLGTQYKIQDYLSALSLSDLVPDWLTLGTSITLSATEFCLGIFLLFAIHRRTVTKLIVVLMAVMTLISIWLWWANPVSDCGCFGDALHLTNGETFAKNIVLLGMALVTARWPLTMVRFISKTNQWIVINYTLLFVIIISGYCLWSLPLFDFRPYHVGANLLEGMEIPETAEQPEFETTFILEKDGVRRTFTLDDYPDSTWTFIDSKTVMTKEGYVPPIHDFSIETADGDDLTDSLLNDQGYTFLLISPHLEDASDSHFGEIDQLYEYSQDHGYGFYCLTASGERGISRWRELTGAEYPFCTTDATTLKTIIRSNPGLLLLHGGRVMRKWSHNQLPGIDALQQPLESSALGRMPDDGVSGKVFRLVVYFVLPLLLLTITDRLWAWTRWLRKTRGSKKSKTKESK
jgi:triosephosphate isomerase